MAGAAAIAAIVATVAAAASPMGPARDAPPRAASHRLAIVASASAADGQPSLRYADRDAERVAGVLRELGGFDRVVDLRQPTPAALRDALARAEAIAAAEPGLDLIFYYSGHADERGLLLGAERFLFDELRARLEGSRAAVRVAFLDACYSGSIVRPKGGTAAAGYALDTVEAPRVRGAAIIAAGTASELAQESGEIEGSYFTHHILSALRGAGDRDGNGAVTLAEAYQYAYSHTLSATLPSVWGPQHPSYEYRLSGAGDLVLTHVGRDRRAMSFPPGQARSYVVSSPGGEVMGEVAAQPRARVRLVLPRGRYRVLAREDRRAWIADVALDGAAAGDTAVEAAAFRAIAPELAFAKGSAPGPRNELGVDLALSGLGPGSFNGTLELGLGYLRRGTSFSVGPHVSYGSTEGTVQGISYALQRWTATMLALRRIPIGISELQLGAGAGVAGIRERFSTTAPRFGWAPSLSVVAAIDLPLGPWLALRFLWSGGVEVLRANDDVRVAPEITASLGGVLRQ